MSTTTDEGSFVLPIDDDEDILDPRDAVKPDEAPPEKTLDELKAENLRLAQQAGDAIAQRDLAKLALERTAPPPAVSPPPRDDTEARQKYEAYMADIGQKRLMGDNEGADKAMLALVDTLVADRVSKAQAPMVAGSARQTVRNFEMTVKDAPEYPKVRDLWMQAVDSAMPGLTQMTPDQQQLAVETLYEVAVGKTARAEARNGRREEPPPYNTGKGGSGTRPMTRQRQLSAVQRQFVKSAREYGMPEDFIARRLDEMERGGEG